MEEKACPTVVAKASWQFNPWPLLSPCRSPLPSLEVLHQPYTPLLISSTHVGPAGPLPLPPNPSPHRLLKAVQVVLLFCCSLLPPLISPSDHLPNHHPPLQLGDHLPDDPLISAGDVVKGGPLEVDPGGWSEVDTMPPEHVDVEELLHSTVHFCGRCDPSLDPALLHNAESNT